MKNKQNIEKLLEKSSYPNSPFEIVVKSIYTLPNERMQEVLLNRFGLNDNKPKTLEAIGKKYGVTRERIRQIENDALKRINQIQKKTGLRDLVFNLEETLKRRQGIMSEMRILDEFDKKPLENIDKNALVFTLNLSPLFFLFNKPKEFEKAWYLKGSKIALIQRLKDWLEGRLTKEEKLMTKKQLLKILNEEEELQQIDDEVLYTLVDIPKNIQQNIFNKWGLAHWPEIKPRGVKDKIYLAFQKENRPLHFREVAVAVNNLGVDNKKICPATVHNELIKDKRYILIGRGIYALNEWNYEKGTVSEILTKILKKNNRPMAKEELVKELLKQRQVKVSTIVLNLNNPNLFKRQGDKYFLVK